MSIATSSDNRPWVSEVHYSYDRDLNLYFISLPSRRHSIEISKNNFVAGNIVKQHGKDDTVRGVYFEGAATMLTEVTESDVSFLSYKDRFGIDNNILAEQNDTNGHRWYKVQVNKFYLFDELEMNPAGKYELQWN